MVDILKYLSTEHESTPKRGGFDLRPLLENTEMLNNLNARRGEIASTANRRVAAATHDVISNQDRLEELKQNPIANIFDSLFETVYPSKSPTAARRDVQDSLLQMRLQ